MVELKDELLTVAEAATLLKVTPHTIYRWIANGRLPAVRYAPGAQSKEGRFEGGGRAARNGGVTCRKRAPLRRYSAISA